MKTVIRGILAVLLLAAAYAATSPAHRLEAEDAYEYAWQADTAAAFCDSPLWHPHHLAYLPAVRILYSALHAAGATDHSYPLMCALSALAAAWSVVGVFLIMRTAGASRGWATVIAAGLGVSYGWWRYAWEAEMYAPAGALAITAVLLALRPRRPGITVPAIIGALATLVHVQAGISAFVAIPVFLWRAGRLRDALRHTLLCGAMVAAAYGAAILTNAWPPDAARGDMGGLERSQLAQMPAKAVIGQGQAIASGNFIFGYATARDRLEKMFPYRMLDEEMQMGRATPGWVKFLAPITLAALLMSIVALAVLRIRTARSAAISKVIAEPIYTSPLRWAAAAWFVGTAAIAALFEPANPEMWILALPPLLILGGIWISTGPAAQSRAPFKVACAAVTLLLLHNAVGGWVPLSTKDGDYARVRGGAALSALRAGDVLVTGDGPVMFRWLRYHAPFGARVESALMWPAEQRDSGYERIRTMLRQSGGRMIILPDVQNPPRGLEGRFGGQIRALRAWAARHEAEWIPAPDVPGAWMASPGPE